MSWYPSNPYVPRSIPWSAPDVKLRHWTKTGAIGTRCRACNQWIPPRSEHECWTVHMRGQTLTPEGRRS